MCDSNDPRLDYTRYQDRDDVPRSSEETELEYMDRVDAHDGLSVPTPPASLIPDDGEGYR